MKRLFPVYAPLILLLLVWGCASPPETGGDSPRKTFRSFAKNVSEDNLTEAYGYMSSDTQERYKLNHFHGLFNKTEAGRLLKWKLKNWEIQDVERVEKDRAFVTLADPEHSDRRNKYEVIKQETKEEGNVWRLRFFLADELDVPRSTEVHYFGSSGEEENEEQEEKTNDESGQPEERGEEEK